MDYRKKAFLAAIKKYSQLAYKPGLYKDDIAQCSLCGTAPEMGCRGCPLWTSGYWCCRGLYVKYATEFNLNGGLSSIPQAKKVLQFIIKRYKKSYRKL